MAPDTMWRYQFLVFIPQFAAGQNIKRMQNKIFINLQLTSFLHLPVSGMTRWDLGLTISLKSEFPTYMKLIGIQ